MSKVKNIIDTLKNQGANPDLSQINLIEKLCKMNISKKFSFKKVFSKDNLLGTYIWGDVGRGKTLITKTYLKELKRDDIKSFHYIDLMSYIHDQLNKNSGVKNPLSKISKTLTTDTSIIFIDEFVLLIFTYYESSQLGGCTMLSGGNWGRCLAAFGNFHGE